MDLQEWRRLAAWIGTVWPAPGYDSAQVEAAYFIVRDFDAGDARAALTDHALTEAVPTTPHPSELRQITQRWVRSKRRPPGSQIAPEPDDETATEAADEELVHALVRDLRRGLGGRRAADPLRFGDPATIEAGRSRVRRLRTLTATGADDSD